MANKRCRMISCRCTDILYTWILFLLLLFCLFFRNINSLNFFLLLEQISKFPKSVGCINSHPSRAKQKLAVDAHLAPAAPYPHPSFLPSGAWWGLIQFLSSLSGWITDFTPSSHTHLSQGFIWVWRYSFSRAICLISHFCLPYEKSGNEHIVFPCVP